MSFIPLEVTSSFVLRPRFHNFVISLEVGYNLVVSFYFGLQRFFSRAVVKQTSAGSVEVKFTTLRIACSRRPWRRGNCDRKLTYNVDGGLTDSRELVHVSTGKKVFGYFEYSKVWPHLASGNRGHSSRFLNFSFLPFLRWPVGPKFIPIKLSVHVMLFVYFSIIVPTTHGLSHIFGEGHGLFCHHSWLLTRADKIPLAPPSGSSTTVGSSFVISVI